METENEFSLYLLVSVFRFLSLSVDTSREALDGDRWPFNMSQVLIWTG